MDGECESQNSYNDNIWHYVVGVWDGQNVKLYVDGVLEVLVTLIKL